MKLIITDIEQNQLKISGDYKIISPENNIHSCIGCFGCWLKTPGECVIKDGYDTIGSQMGKCDEMIFISKCCYGSFSPFVKMIQDRSISYNHPDFVIRKGEMHHKRRYRNVITLSAFFYGENISQREKETACAILQANADNYDGKIGQVYFFNSKEEVGAVLL